MKSRRFIYIAVIILITFQINKHITYSFEVQGQARTRSTVQIGEGPGSYSLPSTAGNPGEVLWINENGELSWKDVLPKPELAFSEPFLITEADCASRSGHNKFLPLNPYYNPTRGYCIATLDGTWEGILRYQDLDGVTREGLIAHDVGRYCDIYYEQAYTPPVGLAMRLWDSITSRLPTDRYWDKFEQNEQDAIMNFINVVKGKKIYLNVFNYFATASLELTAFIVGGFRISETDLEPLKDADRLSFPHNCTLPDDYNLSSESNGNPLQCYAQFSDQGTFPYGNFWDGRFDLDSMVFTRINPFIVSTGLAETSGYNYSSLYAICVR